jgi:hypothetical protein
MTPLEKPSHTAHGFLARLRAADNSASGALVAALI